MAKLMTLKVGLGITAQIGTEYIKPTAEVEIQLDGTETKEQVREAWDNGWNAVSREVEKVIKEYSGQSEDKK
jgi:hypothetical protein